MKLNSGFYPREGRYAVVVVVVVVVVVILIIVVVVVIIIMVFPYVPLALELGSL